MIVTRGLAGGAEWNQQPGEVHDIITVHKLLIKFILTFSRKLPIRHTI
jgi:hypothetical protein